MPRWTRALSDLTIGTVIVLVHVALSDRKRARTPSPLLQTTADGTRIWRSQVSP
jgi:hypothetical protein